ncbi:Isochorismate synthase siderophore [Flavobacterium sp. 9R]|uniref:isochorismate synthase n=1 Tax=Flavobacterium sp. 9R TaxID=2653143 RepID=UPI0012EF3B1E|nr:isochorismate synthase [Flavobacterium sp. 9R]VXC09596.1 Isochorismate synthase siderophore [Flavobacterium sp. 9R]
MIDFFIKVQQQIALNLPFVIYHKPNKSKLIGFFQKNDHLFFVDDFKESGFVFSPFNGNQMILIPLKESVKWETIVPTVDFEETKGTSSDENQEAKNHFLALIEKGVETIKKGIFDKVVLSRQEEVNVSNFDVVTTFEKLIALYPTAFTYCWFHPKIGLWMGATPERLLKANKSKFYTTALAGTQIFDPKKRTAVWGNKEQKEQQYVTDSILDSLKNHTSEIVLSSPYTIQAGKLLHINTDIEGVLKRSSSLKEVVSVLHPTPAVCGLPKQQAKDFILANEGYDRSYYTGFLGELNVKGDYLNKPKSHLFVNLRCMQIKQSEDKSDTAKAYLYMGCGITLESIPEKEWEESVNKSMTMKRVLDKMEQ